MSSEIQNDDVVIRVDHVSKCFQMYDKPRHRLQQMLFGRWHTWYKEFWALKNVSFDVHKGECVGLIGRNGSGKSTILQIITGTLQTTEGSITIKPGLRVAALLELGSGFNPEFTGRDNVYMNAAILGLTKDETDQAFPEIEKFADIGEFIDQPVKAYSSGMMVRLAFAVQIMVKPDILIVDEALAVGDAFFQQKCFQRINELRDKGTTILFVSHDLMTVRGICDRVVYLVKGHLDSVGAVADITEKYFRRQNQGDEEHEQSLLMRVRTNFSKSGQDIDAKTGADLFRIDPDFGANDSNRTQKRRIEYTALDVYDLNGQPISYCRMGDKIKLVFSIRANEDIPAGLNPSFYCQTNKYLDIFSYSLAYAGKALPAMNKGDRLTISYVFMPICTPGKYFFTAAIQADPASTYFFDNVSRAFLLEILPPENNGLINYSGQTFIKPDSVQVAMANGTGEK